MRPTVLMILCAAMLGCTQFPELENTVRSDLVDAPYPELKPQPDLLASAAANETSVEDEEAMRADLAARSAALEARAAQLSALGPEGLQ